MALAAGTPKVLLTERAGRPGTGSVLTAAERASDGASGDTPEYAMTDAQELAQLDAALAASERVYHESIRKQELKAKELAERKQREAKEAARK